jgi:hypothetical protein
MADRQGHYEYPFSKFESKSKSWATAHVFWFHGSDMIGIPKKIRALVGKESSGLELSVRIYDTTNVKTIAECSGCSEDYPSFTDLGDISNVSVDGAMWELQIKRTLGSGNKKIAAGSLTMEF